MKKSLMKCFLLLAFVSGVVAAEARIPAPADSIRAAYERMAVRVEGSSPAVCDMRVVRTKEWTKLARVAGHPAFDSLLTPEKEREILSEVNRRRQEFGRDTMLTADAFYIMRPYYDFLHYVDPHYRVEMMVPIDGRVYKKCAISTSCCGRCRSIISALMTRFWSRIHSTRSSARATWCCRSMA